MQQRLVSTDQLRNVLVRVGPMRWQAQLFAALDDIALGAHSGLELDFLDLVRAAELPEPELQLRVDANGLRSLDATWPAYGVWVEVDGAAHRDDARWQEDLERHNAISVTDQRWCTLRFSGHLLRTKPERCSQQLRAALRRGGWH